MILPVRIRDLDNLEFKRLSQYVAQGRMLGLSTHPQTSRTMLRDVDFIVTWMGKTHVTISSLKDDNYSYVRREVFQTLAQAGAVSAIEIDVDHKRAIAIIPLSEPREDF